MQVNRTFLFAPGNHPRKVEKVFGAGADAVILDLEDAVAAAEKAATRETVVSAMAQPRSCRGYIRINALDTEYALQDLEAVVAPNVDGLVVPKIETPEALATAEWLVTELERKHGLPLGKIDLLPIIETGLGVANARAIAAIAKRTKWLSFGAGDYTRDMAMDWTWAEAECDHARAEIALASRAEGLAAPIDTVWIHLKDEEGLVASTNRIKAMGFQGKLCIHPAQVDPVNSVFTPNAEAVAHATKIVAAFDASEADGSASIQVDGYFVDYPIVEQARRTLALAAAAALSDSVKTDTP